METAKEKYKTARAFRIAVADRLRALATKSGEPHLDLYRRVAIDRFLARIDWSKWTAKGGYILQRRLPKARRTKDIDLSTGDVSFVISDRPAQQQALLEAFQQMAQADAGDYFEFQVLADKPALMASAPFFNSARQRGVVKALLSTHIHRLLVAGH